jgi:hypothetical protein
MLINKKENIITYWCNRSLSQGGRLVLVKYILESIHVYWLSITHVPKGILDHMRKKCYRFLWVGRRVEDDIPLVKWDRIAKPKELGGWGLKNMYAFNQALVAKSLWRMLFNKGLWGK